MKAYFLVVLLFTLVGCSLQKNKVDKIPVGRIETSIGEMLFTFHEKTPNHRDSFINLANNKYWDTLSFNRVIKNFVIQGGCPDTPEGFGDSPYLIKPEFDSAVNHMYGAVGMGRDDNPDKLSAGCQFYIVHNKKGLPPLNQNYVVFGQLIKGFDILDKIGEVATDKLDQPIKDLPIKVSIVYLSRDQLLSFN